MKRIKAPYLVVYPASNGAEYYYFRRHQKRGDHKFVASKLVRLPNPPGSAWFWSAYWKLFYETKGNKWLLKKAGIKE
jgi:hypothetical protein